MTRRTIALAAVAATLTLPAAAAAHVTLQPRRGSGRRLRAPGRARPQRGGREGHGEGRGPAATRLRGCLLRAGRGLDGEGDAPQARRRRSKTDDGDTLTDELATITFTAAKGKGIKPGQFRDFGLSLGLPDKPAGTALQFKALQTYTGGEVVRWIGAEGSEKPAPVVTLVADSESPHRWRRRGARRDGGRRRRGRR